MHLAFVVFGSRDIPRYRSVYVDECIYFRIGSYEFETLSIIVGIPEKEDIRLLFFVVLPLTRNLAREFYDVLTRAKYNGNLKSKCCRESLCYTRKITIIRLKNHITTIDIGGDVLESHVLKTSLESRHLNSIVSSDIDTTEKGEIGRH